MIILLHYFYDNTIALSNFYIKYFISRILFYDLMFVIIFVTQNF